MKEHPILMNGEMVVATLDGRKTQTRRVIGLNMTTLPNHEGRISDNGVLQFRCPPQSIGWSDIFWGNCSPPKSKHNKPIKCPYGQVGDRLYLQEPISIGFGGMGKELGTQFRYINNPEDKMRTVHVSHNYSHSYRPASRMPKYAARTFLEITAIRVERVQDISEGDAKAEGTSPYITIAPEDWAEAGIEINHGHFPSFVTLWESINKKRGYGWEKNPWVWVVEFKKENPHE